MRSPSRTRIRAALAIAALLGVTAAASHFVIRPDAVAGGLQKVMPPATESVGAEPANSRYELLYGTSPLLR